MRRHDAADDLWTVRLDDGALVAETQVPGRWIGGVVPGRAGYALLLAQFDLCWALIVAARTSRMHRAYDRRRRARRRAHRRHR